MTLPREQQASKRIERQQLIQDIKQQNPEVTDEQLLKYDIDDLRKIKMATAPKAQTEQLSQRGMQYGGMADMSAAPMVKQQRQRKRSASSGFRAKYSKGGGVRASKYKL